MKRLSSLVTFLCAGLALLLSSTARGAVVTVTNAATFQAALTAAQNNDEPDTINLDPNVNADTYNTAVTFSYIAAAGENEPLTIVGTDPATTFLVSSGTTALSINTSANNPGADANATVTVQGLGFQASTPFPGLVIQTDQASRTVQGNHFSNTGAAAILIGNTGNADANSNVIDSASEGISITTLSGSASLNVQGNQLSNVSSFSIQVFGAGFATTTVRGNTVNGSSASDGPGISVTGNVVTLDGNAVFDNVRTSLGGGGIVAQTSETLLLTNNIIAGNAATLANSDGGGVFIAGTGAATELTLTNNTITGNSCTRGGGGVFIQNSNNNTVTNLYNNVIFGNTAGANGDDILINDDNPVDNIGSPVNIFNNDFTEFFSVCANSGGCAPDISGLDPDTNLDVDPLFVEPANNNFNLSAGSEAIGFGDPAAPSLPAADFLGNPMNDPPDLGALQVPPNIAVDPPAIDFGSVTVAETASQTLTLSNNGGGLLSIAGMTLSDDVNYALNVNGGADPCGNLTFTLGFGESCTVTVEFTPTVEGSIDATLTISSDDPNVLDTVISLTGVGVTASGNGCSLGASPPTAGGFLILALVPALAYGIRRCNKSSAAATPETKAFSCRKGISK